MDVNQVGARQPGHLAQAQGERRRSQGGTYA
jgi:hypothetical protein